MSPPKPNARILRVTRLIYDFGIVWSKKQTVFRRLHTTVVYNFRVISSILSRMADGAARRYKEAEMTDNNNSDLSATISQELALSDSLVETGDLNLAFHHLERAHVLGQLRRISTLAFIGECSSSR